MTYNAGQVVEVCSEESRGWTSGFKYGSKITLKRKRGHNDVFAGEWDALDVSGAKGIISEEDFRPVPIRTETVTTRRIEPGVYGRLSVWVGDINPNNVYAALTNKNGSCGSGQLLSASEWRELARVALEIAEYLDAQ